MSVIRKKVAIPVLITVCALLIIKFYFLNAIAKAIFVKAAEKTFKAKTEISAVRVSLLGGEVTLHHATIGDKDDPFFNLFAFEKAHFRFSVRAMFRQHVHIDDLSVEGIAFHTSRKISATLPPEKTGKIAAMLDKMTEKPLAELKSQYSLAALTKRLRIDEITDFSQLKTVQKVNDAKDYFQNLPDQLIASYNALQLNQKIDQIKTDIQTIQTFHPKKLQDYQEYITRIQSIQANINGIQANITDTQRLIDTSYAVGQHQLQSIQDQANRDIQTIKDKVALANYSKQHLFQEVLGDAYKKYLNQFNRYYQLYLNVFPKPTTGLESWVAKYNVPGQDIQFPNRTHEAKVLIKNISISGLWLKNTQRFNGSIREITSDQNIRNLPTTLQLSSADLLSDKKITLAGVADFRAHRNLTKLDIDYSGAPLNPTYWDIGSIPFKIDSGSYTLHGGLAFEHNTLTTSFSLNTFKTYFSRGNNYDDGNYFHLLLERIFSRYHQYFIKIYSDNLHLNMDSNIDDMVASEINAYINEQINRIKADLQRQWDEKVAELTKMLNDQYMAIRKQIDDRINRELAKGQKQIDQYKQTLEKLQQEQQEKLKALQAQAQLQIDQAKAQSQQQIASVNAQAQQKIQQAEQQAKATEEKVNADVQKTQEKVQQKVNDELNRKKDNILKNFWR